MTESTRDVPPEAGERAVGDRPKTALGRRLERVRATRAGRLTLKVLTGLVGGVMVIGGLIMVPFPGPGWLVVFAGLAVLAAEFHWARRLLEFGRRALKAWTEWLLRQGWPVRILVTLVAAACASAIVYFALRLSLGIDLIQMTVQFLQR